MDKKRKELIKGLISEFDLKTTDDIQNMLKELMGSTIQSMLEAELDEDLGYEKHDYSGKNTDNSRNGHSSKTIRSKFGDFETKVPRDRKGEFEPQVVKKHQKELGGIEQQIIAMYAKGMSTRDIEEFLRDLYGVEASASLISRITDRIIPEIKEWQSRVLKPVYAIMFLDAIVYKVRKEGTVVNKSIYIAIGIDLEGHKDVLGFWVGESESSKFWLMVTNELKNRGVRDILIASVDGLNGFSDAIHASFPQTEIQRCIVHQIRNSTKYISYKDLKQFTQDLKPVYKAANEEQAVEELVELEKKWGSKYPSAIKSWKNNWDELSTFFKYPAEIRKIIYTTNAIENFNRQLRKVTKTKSAYVSDDALSKSLYLAIRDITKKWTGRVQNWGFILDQLLIFFEDRITEHDI
jgi:transposase-like protein